MATITSTIKLVDRMTPTLNKISKAIDNVSSKSRAIGSAKTWSGFNTGVASATKGTHNLYNALRRVAYTLMALKSLKGAVDIADTVMNSQARINNVIKNIEAQGGKSLYNANQYMDMIYASAQRSRGSFTDMAAQVAKLGNTAGAAFNNNIPHMIAFSELLNKSFRIAGISAQEASNGAYQLTQALAAGTLQGDEMKSILENATTVAQKIADKMGVTVGQVKALGAEGKITSDVIVSAMFEAADEIEERFKDLPRTIGDIWTNIKNHSINAFRPVIQRVQDFINSPTFERFENRVLGIIDKVANGVIWLFDQFERPEVQAILNAIENVLSIIWSIIEQIGGAVGRVYNYIITNYPGVVAVIGAIGTVLEWIWNVFLWVGNIAVSVAQWICDNWSAIAPIFYAVATALAVYYAWTLLSAAAQWVFGTITKIVKGIMDLFSTTLGKVVLIIMAVVLVIYLAVYAWNYFTGQTVSALGVVFGCVAFIVACIVDLFVFLWDCFVAITRIIEFVCKFLWRTGLNIHNTFRWVGAVLDIWCVNTALGMQQLCHQLPYYWEYFKAATVATFWQLVYNAGLAFNNLLKGASDIAKKMISPFENFANAVIDLINGIIRGWNSLANKLTLTLPEFSIAGVKVWDKKEIKLIGNGADEIDPVNWNDWDDPSGINLSGVQGNLLNALNNKQSASGNIKPINWNTLELPSYNEYVNWGSLGDAWNTLESQIHRIWDSTQYANPIEWFKSAYNTGEKVENGIASALDWIGGLLGAIKNGEGLSIGDGFGGRVGEGWEDIVSAIGNGGVGRTELPESLGDLLGSGSGSPKDLLGSIADNTGSSSGSLADIEDTLDLAEEELELLRKIAQQEVINRFTTAEIHVDMTNNNNINSGMDLDGIVTHLSSKLYEELGVVASGVHY